MKGLNDLVKAMQTKENKAARIVKPAKVPAWTEKMTLKTYEKALEVWIHQNRDLSENERFHEVIETLFNWQNMWQ